LTLGGEQTATRDTKTNTIRSRSRVMASGSLDIYDENDVRLKNKKREKGPRNYSTQGSNEFQGNLKQGKAQRWNISKM